MNKSPTISDQLDVESTLLAFLKCYAPTVYALWCTEEWNITKDDSLSFNRRKHFEFIRKNLTPYSWAREHTYSTQPGLVYWAVQAAETLGVTDQLFQMIPCRDLVDYLLLHLADEFVDYHQDDSNSKCLFAGAPRGKGPHLLSSFSACCALAILDVESFRLLPREAMKRWLLSLRNDDGSFCVNHMGETDTRCSYSVAVLTTLLSLDDPSTFPEDCDVAYIPILTPAVADYVLSCQTHEGGFSCAKNCSEAHGSYTLCALGTLYMMGQMHLCYLPSLRRWLANRQCSFEGGFNGRTNKLVDSCYSYWVGASHALLSGEECLRTFLRVTHPSGSVSRKFVLAKEMALLHYLQAVDLENFLTIDFSMSDQEETQCRKNDDLLEKFLGAEDASSRAFCFATTRKKLLWSLINASDETKRRVVGNDELSDAEAGDFYFNQRRLQLYILQGCQGISGGLRDKPAENVDPYHTCYSLSGMSVSQNLQYGSLYHSSNSYVNHAFSKGYLPSKTKHNDSTRHPCDAFGYGVVVMTEAGVLPPFNPLVRSINPVFNLHRDRVLDAWKVWGLRVTL